MQGLWIVREGREQQVVRRGDGPAGFVTKLIPHVEVFKVLPRQTIPLPSDALPFVLDVVYQDIFSELVG